MKHPFTTMVAGALSLVLAAAGCGGESPGGGTSGGSSFVVRASTTVTTGAASTRAHFVARVNQICRKKWRVILENFSQYSSWQGPELTERQLYADSIRESYLAGVDFHIFDSIFKMGAPKGQERAVEEVIGAMQAAVETGQRVVAVDNAAKLEALFGDYNAAAREYGFVDCLVESPHLPKLSPPV
jgi:hypothetical protein